MQSKSIFAILAIAIFTTLACKKESTTPTAPTNTTTTNNTTVKENVKWMRANYVITYKADGITEQSRQETVYDSEKRPIETTTYYNGALSGKSRDYTYTGDECTYFYDSYTNGQLTSTTKYKIGYNNQ